MPDQYGNWLPQDLFAGAIPQLQPKWDSSQNMLTAPGLGVPTGLAGGVVGTAVGNPLIAGAVDAAKVPGDVYQGKVDLNSPAGFGRVQNMAGMLMGGGMPMAEAGSLGIAGGKLSAGRGLNDIISDWRSKGVKIDASVHGSRPDLMTVGQIVVPEASRGQGIGTTAMGDLIDHADGTGKTIALSPSTDFGASSVTRLKKFYKDLGFVENKGRNKDFTISETMYRPPTDKP